MPLKDDLLRRIGDYSAKESVPFYLYDSATMRKHCQMFLQVPYPNKSIHFATMANNNPVFLKILKEEGLHVFVNSIEHLKVVQNCGFENEEIVYTASALNEKTMSVIHESQIQVNLDSPLQLQQWFRLFPDSPVGIRCNIGDGLKAHNNHAGSFIGSRSRLGFTREEMEQIQQKDIINGLHLYAGTDIFDIDYLLACYREIVALAQLFPNLDYLNFGGGFGVSENWGQHFNIDRFGCEVTALMEMANKAYGKELKLILEPGRIIGAEAGFFICHAADLKTRGNLRLIGVDASSVQFPRPLFYPEIAKHPVVVFRKGQLVAEGKPKLSSIYGCSTYSRDFLASEVLLPPVEIGDTLVFGNAGSYCSSLYTRFLGFSQPEEVFI